MNTIANKLISTPCPARDRITHDASCGCQGSGEIAIPTRWTRARGAAITRPVWPLGTPAAVKRAWERALPNA